MYNLKSNMKLYKSQFKRDNAATRGILRLYVIFNELQMIVREMHKCCNFQ